MISESACRRPCSLGRWLLVLLLAGPFGSACATQPVSTDQTSAVAQPQRVLFVGNSYFYYNDSLHNHVERMVQERFPNADLAFKSATIGGADLSQHPLPSLLAPGRLGVDDPFDVVILQGGSFETLTPQAQARFERNATRMTGLVRETGAEPYLYITPAYVAPHPRVAQGQTEQIVAGYGAAAQLADANLIPVGPAFALAYAERPEMVLHKPFDGSHPSLLGTYLAACVVFEVLYDQSSVGLGYDYFGAIDPQSRQFLQRIAHQAVEQFNARDL